MVSIQLSASSHNQWGLGYLYPNNKKFLAHNIHIPTRRLSLYKKPSEASSLYIIQNHKDYFDTYLFDDVKKTKNPIDLTKGDFIEISYGGYCLKYFEIKKGYVKILVNNSTDGYWISLKKLFKDNYSYKSWISEVINTKRTYFSIVSQGINLRMEPTIKSKIITLVRGMNFAVVPTGRKKGLWLEVKVQKYKKGVTVNCVFPEIDKPVKTYKGWLKAFDDDLYPNIWFEPRGC